GAQLFEMELATRLRPKGAARTLLGPLEQSRGAIGEGTVVCVLGLVERCRGPVALDQMNAAPGHAPRGGEGGREQERRPSGRRRRAHRLVLLPHVAPERAVSAQ